MGEKQLQSIEYYLYEVLKHYHKQFLNKDDMTLDEINEVSSNYLNNFYLQRIKLHKVIMSDKQLFLDVYDKCSKDFMFFILLFGISVDLNRNQKAQFQPVLPYPHQMPLIEAFDSDNRHILVEKARRQGASLIMALRMAWELIFGDNIHNFTTHRDLASLDKKLDYVNSTFGKVKLILKNCFYVDMRLFDNKRDDMRTDECRIVYKTNSLIGQVASPTTSVGMGVSSGFLDEFAVSCSQFPSTASYILGAISSSANRLILYSTHRGTNNPFYEIVSTNDTKFWNIITMRWQDNILCNTAWYEKMKSSSNYDKVVISQEFDINPTASVKGRVYDYITDTNRVSESEMTSIMLRGSKKIGMDAGGGGSDTVLVMAYFDGINIYLHDAIKSTNIDEHQIKRDLLQRGFTSAPIGMDIAGKSQANTPNNTWLKLLQKVGLDVRLIPNQGMHDYYAKTNFMFMEGKIKYNKNCKFFRDLENGVWETESNSIKKNGASHLCDAVAYLVRMLFPNSTFSTF